MDTLLYSILPFVGILVALIVIHEFGHYMTAKMFGVKVLEGGLGYPPRMFGFTWRGTIYSINWIPLGGFVRLLGEEDPTDPESLAVMVPGPVEKDMNNFAPSLGFNWARRSSSSLIGDGKTVIRGGFRMGYDVLFYNLLTVNGSNYPRIATASINNVLDTYPSLLAAGGSAVGSHDPGRQHRAPPGKYVGS